MVVTSIFITNFISYEKAYAQAEEKVSISFNASLFGSSIQDDDVNKLMFFINYETKDPSLNGATINGVMNVYDPEGSLVKSNTYENGFTITDSGNLLFTTSLTDQSLDTVNVEVVLTDLNKAENISNVVSNVVIFDEDTEMPSAQDVASGNLPFLNKDNNEVKRIPSKSQSGLNITSSNSYLEGDNFYIVGEVLNSGENDKEFVKVSATLYDENNGVIGTDFGYTEPSTITAGESSPFKILVGSDDVSTIDDIRNYKITASAND